MKNFHTTIKTLFFLALFTYQIPKNLSGQAISAEKSSQIDKACQKYLTKSLLIWKDGDLMYKYGDDTKAYNIFSVRKSLTSLLIGIYADKGLININSSLQDLQIDDIKGLSEQEKKATVLDLLKAKSGVYHQAAFETPGMRKNRPERDTYKAGEFWFYNNWDFNALITILEKASGESIFKSFQEKIAQPLRMNDFDLDKQTYILEDTISMHRATLWRFSARDLLKIGLLMLNKGRYNDQQIIPEQWVQQSTQSYSDLGILGGYGFCWWVAYNQLHYPFVDLPDGTFSARGTGEQSIVVIPAQNTVIVHMTEVNSPSDPMMKVTEFGRLLRTILNP